MRGYGRDEPSHHELLIRMGEELGVHRDEILNKEPLPKTKEAVELWNSMAAEFHWIEIMAAMHSLELIASRNLPKMGASIRYFNPDLLKDSNFPQTAKDFLREGYEADVGHSEEALKLIGKYAEQLDMVEEVQSAFLRSIDAFDRYLESRLERAKEYEN
jgi:pyrroloquinoline-quinone synthase